MMKSKRRKARKPIKAIAFKKAIENTPDVANGYCTGLGAIKRCDLSAISLSDSASIDGSLDIDGQTISIYPEEPRWDYAIGYNGRVYYVEVHPANTSDIDDMIKKKEWLLNWLRTKAPKINALEAGTPKFLWAATKAGVHISKQSLYAKKLAQLGLIPVRPVIIR